MQQFVEMIFEQLLAAFESVRQFFRKPEREAGVTEFTLTLGPCVSAKPSPKAPRPQRFRNVLQNIEGNGAPAGDQLLLQHCREYLRQELFECVQNPVFTLPNLAHLLVEAVEGRLKYVSAYANLRKIDAVFESRARTGTRDVRRWVHHCLHCLRTGKTD
ncbi:MAG TPA: hypothetical protein VH601_24480 [Bryobacteraceae bacterium]